MELHSLYWFLLYAQHCFIARKFGLRQVKTVYCGRFCFSKGKLLATIPHQLPKISLPVPFSLAAVKADDIVKTRKTFCSSIKTAAEGLFPVFFWLCARSVFILCLHEEQPDGIVLVLCTHNAQTDDPLDVFAQDIVQRGVLFRPDSRGGSRRLFVLVCFI